LKVLTEQRLTSPEQEGILAADCLGFELHLFPKSPVCWPIPSDFGLATPPQSCEPIP